MTQPQTNPGELGPALESLLVRLLTEHERLLTLTAAHRSAISRADTAGIEAAIADQRLAADVITRLEVQRQQLMAGAVKPGATPTLSTLAEGLAEPHRTAVLSLSARLRDTIGRVRREHGVIRAATESLLAHMEGLVAQISRRLSRTGVYGPQGAVRAGAQVVSALDLTH